MTQNYTPVVIVSGFLGSGKTTLLKRFLQNDQNLRIALIRNEYTDAQDITFECPLLIRDEDSSIYGAFWELPNSCVCCSVKTQFVQGVTGLVERGHEESRPFDLVLIEVSGVADPMTVGEGIIDSEDDDPIRYAGCICVCDGHLLPQYLLPNQDDPNIFGQMASLMRAELQRKREADALASGTGGGSSIGLGGGSVGPGGESSIGPATSSIGPDSAEDVSMSVLSSELQLLMAKQICVADLVLLNKMDLIQDPSVAEDIIRSYNPAAEIVKTTYSAISAEDLRAFLARPPRVQTDLEHIHSHPTNSHLGCHVESKTIICNAETIDQTRLEESLQRLIWSPLDMRIFRVKGLFRASHDRKWKALQVVGEIIKFTEEQQAESANRFLIIGQNLRMNILETIVNDAAA